MKRAHVFLLLCPWIAAPKCFATDPYYVDAGVRGDDAGEIHDGASVSSEDAAGGDSSGEDVELIDAHLPDSSFRPARACAVSAQFPAGVARIRISARTFNIDCGCLEDGGRTCTIPAGVTVIWRFEDSEEHDVSGSQGVFPGSGERLAGTWSNTFNSPGTYPYLCNIHSLDMTGYTIVVE